MRCAVMVMVMVMDMVTRSRSWSSSSSIGHGMRLKVIASYRDTSCDLESKCAMRDCDHVPCAVKVKLEVKVKVNRSSSYVGC